MKSELERKIFWELFEKILKENGDPFKINYVYCNTIRSWAVVNKNRTRNTVALDLDFILNGIFRINLYIENDLDLYNKLLYNRKDIENSISVPLFWVQGTKGENTRRIKCEIPFKANDNKDYNYNNFSEYERVIKIALPIILQFKKVAEKYDKSKFFDY